MCVLIYIYIYAKKSATLLLGSSPSSFGAQAFSGYLDRFRMIDCKPSVPQGQGAAGAGSRARKVFVGGLSAETSEGRAAFMHWCLAAHREGPALLVFC